MKQAASAYAYSVQWSPDDACWIGRCSSFGLLAAHGDTASAALDEIRAVVAYVLEDLWENGEPIPDPKAGR